MDSEAFHDLCVGDGFEAPGAKVYPSHDRPDLHAHPFDARVLITEGELVLAFADSEIVLAPGDTCDVPAGTLHSERTSATGATGLLAVRHAV